MKNNIFVVLMALCVAILATAMVSATVPIEITNVEVNGIDLDEVGNLDVERGEEIKVEVYVKALDTVEDARLEVSFNGYHYDKYERDIISDAVTFDLTNGTNKRYTFYLEAPLKIGTEEYDLRVEVSDKKGEDFEILYPVLFSGVSDEKAVSVKDFTVSPSNVVEAGRPLSFKLKVKNYGDSDLDDVNVRVSIPELGIADDEYMDELLEGESETFEELLLRIPTCANPGTYVVEALVEFDEYESTKETMTITVLKGGSCEVTAPVSQAKGKTVVTIPESQEVVLGTTGGVYPVMISNLGSSAKTYTLTVSGVDAWGTVRFDPAAVVVVQPESVKTVYMYVAAKENAEAGAQVFKLAVESEDDNKQVVLTANVKAGENKQDAASSDGLRRGLEVGLIVLVVILIILGLIIGFNKIRGDKGEEEESQTYY